MSHNREPVLKTAKEWRGYLRKEAFKIAFYASCVGSYPSKNYANEGGIEEDYPELTPEIRNQLLEEADKLYNKLDAGSGSMHEAACELLFKHLFGEEVTQ